MLVRRTTEPPKPSNPPTKKITDMGHLSSTTKLKKQENPTPNNGWRAFIIACSFLLIWAFVANSESKGSSSTTRHGSYGSYSSSDRGHSDGSSSRSYASTRPSSGSARNSLSSTDALLDKPYSGLSSSTQAPTNFNAYKEYRQFKDNTYVPYTAENGTSWGEISTSTLRPKTTYVNGYTRSNGTYVRGHYRSRAKK